MERHCCFDYSIWQFSPTNAYSNIRTGAPMQAETQAEIPLPSYAYLYVGTRNLNELPMVQPTFSAGWTQPSNKIAACNNDIDNYNNNDNKKGLWCRQTRRRFEANKCQLLNDIVDDVTRQQLRPGGENDPIFYWGPGIAPTAHENKATTNPEENYSVKKIIFALYF